MPPRQTESIETISTNEDSIVGGVKEVTSKLSKVTIGQQEVQLDNSSGKKLPNIIMEPISKPIEKVMDYHSSTKTIIEESSLSPSTKLVKTNTTPESTVSQQQQTKDTESWAVFDEEDDGSISSHMGSSGQNEQDFQTRDTLLLTSLQNSRSINKVAAVAKKQLLEGKLALMTPNHANIVVRGSDANDIGEKMKANREFLEDLLKDPISDPSVRIGSNIDEFRFMKKDRNGMEHIVYMQVSKSMTKSQTPSGPITRHFPGISTKLPSACVFDAYKSNEYMKLDVEFVIPMSRQLPIKCFLQGISTGDYIKFENCTYPDANYTRYSEISAIVNETYRRRRLSKGRFQVKIDRPVLFYIGHIGSDKCLYMDSILIYYCNVLDHQLLIDVTHLDEIRSFTHLTRDREEFVNRDFPFSSDKLAKICVLGGITLARLIEKGVTPFPSTPIMISENRGFLDISVDAPWFESKPVSDQRSRREPDRIILLTEVTLAVYREGEQAVRVAKKRLRTGDLNQLFFFIDGDMELMWNLIERKLEKSTLLSCYEAILSVVNSITRLSNAQLTNVYVPQLCRSADYLMEDFPLTPSSALFLNARNREAAMTELMNLHQNIDLSNRKVYDDLKGQGVITSLDKDILVALKQTENKIHLPNVHLAQFNFKPQVYGVNPNAIFHDSKNHPIVSYRHHEMIPDVVKFGRGCMVLIRSPQGSFFTLPRPN